MTNNHTSSCSFSRQSVEDLLAFRQLFFESPGVTVRRSRTLRQQFFSIILQCSPHCLPLGRAHAQKLQRMTRNNTEFGVFVFLQFFLNVMSKQSTFQTYSMFTHTHTYIPFYVLSLSLTHTHTHTHTQTHRHKRTHTHTNTQTYTHTHTCTH